MASGQPEPAHTLVASLILSAIAYYQTAALVPRLGPQLVAKGLGGVDMLKAGFRREELSSSGLGEGGSEQESVPKPRGVVL